MTTEASFDQYGTSFQEKIVIALLTDKQWAEQSLDVMKPEYFSLKYLQFLSGRYFDYAKKYRLFPSLEILVTIVKDELKATADAALKVQVIDFIKRVKAEDFLEDLPYVKDKSLDFCKRQALKGALEEAIDLIQKEKYESIVDVVKGAVIAGTESSLGHDFFNDIDARFVNLKRDCVPTGIPQLDMKGILNGGLAAGELCVIAAASGVGKSHFLTMLGANALREGKKVLHYTFELSAEQIGLRYDSNLCNIDSNDLIENKDIVVEMYKGMNLGRLFIKYYPTNTATVNTLKAHVEKLTLKGFRPDIILIDYADIMQSTRKFDSLRHELVLVYRELRGLAGELGVPIATASQVNREGAEAEVVDMTNMSEAFGKVFIADVVLTISRRSVEKASGWGRLFMAKNRFGRDGLVYNTKINTARSTFEVMGDSTTPEMAGAEDRNDTHNALLEKWKKFQAS
jgi:replicative DNA helicase